MNWVIIYRTESQFGIWKTLQQIFFCHKQLKVTKIKLQPVLLLHRIVTLQQRAIKLEEVMVEVFSTYQGIM